MNSISQLKNTWNIDKNAFQNKELGGLQDFVKNMLTCPKLFNLTIGRESTRINKRKQEFTIETSREGRRADFVIYINGNNIVIPVVVEKFGNINKGIEQLFRYQKDWKKKYGILTDGNEWRFYKSSQYKSFYINDILDNPTDFKTYWNFYIKPENYYIELFEPDMQKELFNNQLDLNLQHNRLVFFDEITQLIDNFKVKMLAIGAFKKIDNKNENNKIAVETSYAYLIQFILYKVLVDNEYKKFKKEYDKMLLKIRKAIKDSDFYLIIINEIKNISEYISSNIYKPFEHEQKSINKKLIENLRQDLTIIEIAPWLDIILFINRYNFAGLRNEIFGFIYENFLKDLYNDNNKGQYFTDPSVVNFMLDEIGYNKKELKKNTQNKISIIDPSCGAGTFLYSSVARIIEAYDKGTQEQAKIIENLIDKNIYGLDIEEFPLYLAEMNILMRLLPLIVNDDYENPIKNKLKIFKTKDSISEFLDIGISSKKTEINLFSHFEKTSLGYKSFMRDEKNMEEMLMSMQGTNDRKRFDYVIGNPPYISYNQCCRQKIDFTQKIKDKTDSFTMANVYDVNLNTVPGRRKPYSPKPNLYSFFIALGLALLKEGGKLSYIIPQTVLIAKDLDVIRFHLAKNTTIEKIITFEGNLFIERGLRQNKPIATSSLIFVVRKEKPKKEHKIKIINYHSYNKKTGVSFKEYLNSTNKDIQEKLQSDLSNNIVNWNFIKQDKLFIEKYNKYKQNSYSIEEYRKFDLKNYDEISIDGGLKLINNNISTQKTENCYVVFNSKKNNYNNYTISKSNLFYDKNNEIKFIPGGQGMRAFKNKYKIIWKTRFNNIFQFSDIENLILKGNQSLLISSDNKNEIFWLLSILNCQITLNILSANTKLPNESKYIVALSSIKQFIHIPKITQKNQFIKDEIIKQTEYLLSLEKIQLKDFVEFTTTKQKISDIEIESNNLILIDKIGTKIKQKIKSKFDLTKTVVEKYKKEISENEFSLHKLKYTQALDKEQQIKVKSYIDNLVFALYFNISIKKVGLLEAKEHEKLCQKNKFYK